MLESELKSKSRTLLEKWGWLVIHLIQTNANGIPDTLILRNGQAYFIEFKQPGAHPRPLQSYRIDKLRQQGFQTLVITDIRQLEFLK
jgi:hypothetical protein